MTATGKASVTLVGNELDNVMTGNTGKNTIRAGAGNDEINGGYGNDRLYGSWAGRVHVQLQARHVDNSIGR